MTDRPSPRDDPASAAFDGEGGQTDDLAPELDNEEQGDEDEQAQTLGDESLGRGADDYGLDDTVKVSTGDETDDVQDLVDHMRQMVSSGRIDNSAYAGEPNFDDNEDKYGPGAKEDDLPSDGE